MKKRIISIILCICLIYSSVFAATIQPGSGTGTAGTYGGSSSGYGFTTLATGNPGLYLNVIQSDTTIVADNGTTKDTNEWLQSFQRLLEEYINDLPHTDVGDGVYLIPTLKNAQGVVANNPNGVQYVVTNGVTATAEQIANHLAMGEHYAHDNNLGKYAYLAATAAGDNPSLSETYWRTICSDASNISGCKVIVSHLFTNGPNGITNGEKLNEYVQAYLDFEVSSTPEELKDMREFFNYCGLLATVICALPESVRTVKAKQLDGMCQNYLAGQSFNPLVVSGELIVASFWNDSSLNHWWRPRACLEATTGVNWAPVFTSTAANSIVKRTLIERYSSTKAKKGYYLYGDTSLSPFVAHKYGTATAPLYGPILKSVNTDILKDYGVTLEGTEGGTPLQPVEGVGIWGISPDILSHKWSPSTPVGSVGLLVQEKAYEKSKGSYTQTFNLTVTVNLGVQSEDKGVTSFAGGLRHLAEMQDKKVAVGDPYIDVYLKQADAISALSGDKASALINQTYGYWGDGNAQTDNSAGVSVSSNQIESDLGVGLTWKSCATALTLKDPGVVGMTIKQNADGIRITIPKENLWAAAEYFEDHSNTLTFVGDVTGSGTLATDTSKNQHWFKVGANVTLYVDSGATSVTAAAAGLRCKPKYDYSTITAGPSDTPYYYSRYTQPYAELKQGTVPTSGGGSSETFNSMTGTPTFTETSNRTDFNGTIYQSKGHYYQYFASGGSEFVVQFDGKYVENATATRNFTINFSTADCGQNSIPHVEHTVTTENGSYTVHDDGGGIHHQCTPHSVTTNTVSFSIKYTGLCYIQITNAKVWKLSDARLDGTRELLDTNEVTATVQSTAPTLFYNVASSNTSAAGRMVYDYLPNGAGAGGNADSLVWNFSTPGSCSGSFESVNLAKVQDIIKNSAAATCVSDFIVLRTTNGDQSILYHEYRAGEGTVIAASATTTTTSPSTGTTAATITVTGGAKDSGVAFAHKTYDELWTSNAQTSKGSGMTADDITFGGYNGNYSSPSSKYQSTGHASNITLESTTAYKNASGAFKPTAKPTQKFRLLNDKLVIPDTKQNGEYVVGESEVFYENILNTNTSVLPNYPIVKQSKYGNRYGFVVKSTYSPTHNKINDVVVYNPVSNQNAMVISLPPERDQRVKNSATGVVTKPAACPGDATCPYLKNECTVTDHIHTEDCYTKVSYTVAAPFTTHVHNASCPYHMTSMQWYHTGGCTYEGQTHTTTSTAYCTTCGHSCGYLLSTGGTKVYDCGNLPLNAYAPEGDMQSGDTKTFSYTGGMQQVTLAPGTYKLECYGAQGGGFGGAGGYSSGQITLTTTTTLYIGVGGQNATFNGGGYGYDYNGGGATHIATATGQLSALSSNKSAVLLVAGGGGAGYSFYTYGGAGGGANAAGAIGVQGCGSPGGGGTLSSGGAAGSTGNLCASAGSFGQGGTSSCNFGRHGNSECGGGGGYYGGGGGGHDCYYCNDNDDSGGGGGSGYASSALSSVTGSSGTNYGNGKAIITAISVTPSQQSYTVYKSVLSCSDPHHAHSYNWKLYTYGLMHKDGTICTGRNCTNKTDLVFPTQEVYTQAQCAAGYIVKHANGDVHLSTTTGVCSYCGNTYQTILSAAQSTDRTPAASEYSCYPYGDSRCWAPCGNPANHQDYTTEITDGGVTYTMGDFVNLDWKFQLYFPNTGDFYGTGAAWSSTTTAERGKGYVNNMDATEWTKMKWVEFPFAVLYNNQTFTAGERIYLSVPQTVFDFYVPLQDDEVAQAEIKYGTVAINAQNGETLECGTNANHNIQAISYFGKPLAHHHNADKRSYIDVVGRIGALTLEDTGDFRFSNLFKKTTSDWLVKNVVRKVDFTKPNYLFSDQVDVRGVNIGNTGTGGNTYGSKSERNDPSRLLALPITPTKNNITALQRQPIRLGYDTYFDLTTLGNYYGAETTDVDGTVLSRQLVLIKPHYYRLDLDTGRYDPVDVYMDVSGRRVLVNDFDSRTVAYSGTDANVKLNWTEESARRNYSGYETNFTNNVKSAYSWVTTPSGSGWTYGNYNILNLTQRNRTFIGSENTYTWDKDPSDKLPDVRASLQGSRWHFNIGLPSSATFVYSGQSPTDANVTKCSSGNAVVFCALEIYAQGEVWTLGYDGSNVNKEFHVIPGDKGYDPVVYYPGNMSPKGEEMPIVAVFSINKSSKLDLNITGTH